MLTQHALRAFHVQPLWRVLGHAFVFLTEGGENENSLPPVSSSRPA